MSLEALALSANARQLTTLKPYPYLNISKIDYIIFGPGLGYGYTFVFNKRFFATAMASVSADVSYIKEWRTTGALSTRWKFYPNLNLKSAIGYNRELWGIGFSYASSRLFLKGSEADQRFLNYNDTYKLMYMRRIKAGKTVPKVTGFAKKIINKVGLGFLVN